MTAAAFIRGGARAPCMSGSSASALNHKAQHRSGAGSMSFEKFFNDRFAKFLQENFAKPTQVAAAFSVRERTAENWWQGTNCPGGAKVALAFTFWPQQASEHLTGQETCASSKGQSSAPSSSPATSSRQVPTGSRGKRRSGS